MSGRLSGTCLLGRGSSPAVARSLPPPCRFAERQRQQQQQAAAKTEPPPQPAAETSREEVATLRKEQAAFERAAMEAEQQLRTQEKVDAMWQSLE